MARDYYAVLGVTQTARPRELRQAYRRLARQYSPDVNLWDVEARSLFEEISEAYRVLMDPVARGMYDRLGRARAGALGGGRRGDDVHAAVELSFEDVARGVSLDLPVPRFSPCRACKASGTAADEGCATCGGRGVVHAVELVAVHVPPGVDTGTQLRFPGEGSAGPFGGPRGDLFVSTRVREHPFFKRKGDSVHCEMPITVWEALRGARIHVPTPMGETVLVVPAGTAGGVFRLRGHGLPKLTDEGIGDLFVTICVEIPRGFDARTDELVRQLERLLPMEPRAELARYRGGAA